MPASIVGATRFVLENVMKKDPANYLTFIRLFPQLTKGEQLRLLAMLAPPSVVHRALRTTLGEMYNAELVRSGVKR